jgi:hypothetical protein
MSIKTSVPSKPAPAQDKALRPGLKWVIAGLLLLCLAGLFWLFRGQPSGPASPAELAGTSADTNASARENPSPAAQKPAGAEPVTATAAAPTPAPAPNVPTPAPIALPATVDPAMGALVTGLSKLSGTNVALTAEAAAAWRTNFMELVRNGSAAVPAIRAFLDQKADYPFSQEVWQTIGYSSARLAAIDALRQIGGVDAVGAMQSLLGSTQTPKEIAVLARNLEEASPGQYRGEALAAARSGLATALGSKDPQLDVAPLFEVFQHYGDASLIPELEKAMDQWKYYATITLANLPDNAGLPSILRMADPASGSGSRVVALEMVAQLAANNPDARQFLATQVANKTIPPNLWPYLASPLAGDQYYPVDSAITQYPQLQSMSDLKTTHLAYGNQNLYTLPGNQNLTADGIQQRLTLIDELLKSASDQAAIQTLQQAKDTLTQRATRAAAQPVSAGGP